MRLFSISLKNLKYYIVSLVLAAVFFEGVAIIFYTVRNGGYKPPSELYMEPNIMLQALKERDCAWVNTVVPHPHLHHVHIPDQSCKNKSRDFNRLGFFGREIPISKDERFFDILLTGGSVAAFLGQMFQPGPLFLEEALNARYESPTGQPFRVLNGAVGAWQQPNQLVMTALYGRAVSAVVTLEGFNEHWRFDGAVRTRLGSPSETFYQLVAPGLGDVWPLAAGRAANALRSAFSTTPVVRHSTFFFALFDLARTAAPARSRVGSRRAHDLRKSFMFPETLPPEHRLDWQFEQYRHYLSMIDAMSRRIGIRFAVFIQPVPLIDKPLTPDEEDVVGTRRYEEIYERLVMELLVLRDQGVEVVSLLDAFHGVTETIYTDIIHPKIDSATGEGEGYRILAGRMAQELARAWGLRPKGGD